MTWIITSNFRSVLCNDLSYSRVLNIFKIFQHFFRFLHPVKCSQSNSKTAKDIKDSQSRLNYFCRAGNHTWFWVGWWCWYCPFGPQWQCGKPTRPSEDGVWSVERGIWGDSCKIHAVQRFFSLVWLLYSFIAASWQIVKGSLSQTSWSKKDSSFQWSHPQMPQST